MMVGTVIFFCEGLGNKSHGQAKIPGERKPVRLPVTVMKAVEGHTLRKFRDDEKQIYPGRGSKILCQYQQSPKGPIASKWGVIDS